MDAEPTMIYPIVKYGDPVLETAAKPVTEFDDKLKQLVEDMFESMYEAQGVGLAAPQIQNGGEGCLSIPEFRENLARAQRVTIRAQDVNGNWYEKTGEDLLARAFQHEIDHLNGKLYIHHLSSLKRDMMKRKIKRLVRQGEW